jgi:hypothetical protein
MSEDKMAYAPSCDSGERAKLAKIEGVGALLSLFRFGSDPIREMQRIHARHGALAQFSFNTSPNKAPRRYILAVGARYNKRVWSDPETF